jgi:hypothetical protein
MAAAIQSEDALSGHRRLVNKKPKPADRRQLGARDRRLDTSAEVAHLFPSPSNRRASRLVSYDTQLSSRAPGEDYCRQSVPLPSI